MTIHLIEYLKKIYESSTINLNLESIDSNVKLLYCCAKIEKLLQDIIDLEGFVNNDDEIKFLHKELLKYCIKVLKLQGINIDSLDFQKKQDLYGDEVYSLTSYAISRLEKPDAYIYDRNFKLFIKSIITQIMTSSLFDQNLLKNDLNRSL